MINRDDIQSAEHQQFVTRQLSSGDPALHPGPISGLEKGKLARNKEGLCLQTAGQRNYREIESWAGRKLCHRGRASWQRWGQHMG